MAEISYAERRLAEIAGVTLGADLRKQPKYPPGTTEKPCSKCKIVKPLSEYSEQKYGALGLQPRCKSCVCKAGKEQYRKQREAQAGRPRPDRCDCCQRVPTRLNKAMHWDHCHATNRFRGWLCHHCNIALGCVDDSIQHLNQLIQYLERGGGPPKR